MLIKSSLKYLLYLLLIIPVIFLFSSSQTQAAVPVVVYGDYLNCIKNINDEDPGVYDLEAKIYGDLAYSEDFPNDATVSYTQKLESDIFGDESGEIEARREKEAILDKIIENIEDRYTEIENEIADEEAKDNPDQNLIDALNDALEELDTIESDTEDLKERLVDSIALDVHVVKDSTSLIEDLKSQAREKLARQQVGELSTPIKQLYNKQFIDNYNDYLTKEPIDAGKTYLDNKYFDIKESESVFSKDETEDVIEILQGSLSPFYDKAAKPKKTLTVDVEDVLDSDKGGGWEEFVKLYAPNNNPNWIVANAYLAANEIVQERRKEHEIQAVAFQGVRPVSSTSTDDTELGPEGTTKQLISRPGSLVHAERSAVAQTELDLAATPEHASAETSILLPDSTTTPPYEDVLTSQESEENFEWYNDIAEDALIALEDVFCACFPEACEGYDSLEDLLKSLGFDFPEISTEVEICDEYFDICSYFPEICGFGFWGDIFDWFPDWSDWLTW